MGGVDDWEQAEQAWRRLAAVIRRSGADDGLAALSDVGTVRRALDQAELKAVRAARQRGKSWAEIATYLGVTRQSAWERWRDLDASPRTGDAEEDAVAVPTTLADAAGHLIDMRVRERGRGSSVVVPDVVGLEWTAARDVLNDKGLVAVNAAPETAAEPDDRGWIVTDQSPEAGAWVATGSSIRLWLNGEGGAGVREPRRPHPTPRSARELRPDPTDQAVG